MFVHKECRRIFILNMQLYYDIIDNIRTVHMNLNEFVCSYEAQIAQNANNSLRQRNLLHPDDDLGEINVVECH